MNIVYAMLLSWFLVGLFISVAKRRGWGQTVRRDGPSAHVVKEGTPTAGGVPLLLAIVAVWGLGVIGGRLEFQEAELVVIASAVLMGVIGFIDDFLKVRARLTGRPTSTGLRAREKFAMQFIVGAAFGVAAANLSPLSWPGLGFWFDAPFYMLLMVGAVNAFNFTDGLDGLAGGVTAIVLLPLVAISPVAAITLGAIGGFLWFNLRPASVFMGDTGSHALGAAATALYVLYGYTWYLPLVAIVPIAEVLSVVIQVAYFRRTGGKRFFRMTPIHHHFELGGWQEGKVTGRFWMITMITTALAWALMSGAQ
ncbi:phospho-N-acetylmuramoyl-pentapeptide-transferase [Deinobacterium chartae]|uniref:Phospho-N-acetylmuramoyl-pentapeptide-transferase n=1 Tax=Deinobacterium chartae TaxID=521158 RepID=A0A841I0Q5_9DEIO|nr:phospho-N-acetylmuramoyl-pentapeptide-transferase [Deinobacterium chartae]MBB6098010.1 phospho-N-acetylmuramoyl-pentapeptide-transferase [Deinobacterium chartae]